MFGPNSVWEVVLTDDTPITGRCVDRFQSPDGEFVEFAVSDFVTQTVNMADIVSARKFSVEEVEDFNSPEIGIWG